LGGAQADAVDDRLLLWSEHPPAPKLLSDGAQELALPLAARLQARQLSRQTLNGRGDRRHTELLDVPVQRAKFGEPVSQLVARITRVAAHPLDGDRQAFR